MPKIQNLHAVMQHAAYSRMYLCCVACVYVLKLVRVHFNLHDLIHSVNSSVSTMPEFRVVWLTWETLVDLLRDMETALRLVNSRATTTQTCSLTGQTLYGVRIVLED